MLPKELLIPANAEIFQKEVRSYLANNLGS
jgi:hypothetical protein